MKGHTGDYNLTALRGVIFIHYLPDIGTITVLYSQPIAALQILGPDGKWKWVKHIENALVRIPLYILVVVPSSLSDHQCC